MYHYLFTHLYKKAYGKSLSIYITTWGNPQAGKPTSRHYHTGRILVTKT